ncbi:MAG: hypothetical protein ABH828_01890 [archaeon]
MGLVKEVLKEFRETSLKEKLAILAVSVPLSIFGTYMLDKDESPAIYQPTPHEYAMTNDAEYRKRYLDWSYADSTVKALSADEDRKRAEVGALYDGKTHQEVMNMVKTPEQARDYCIYYLNYQHDDVTYGVGDYWASFKEVHNEKKDDCDGGAVAACATLDRDVNAWFAMMTGDSTVGHAITIYQGVDKHGEPAYGTIGINKGDYTEPRFKSAEDIMKYYNHAMGSDYDTIQTARLDMISAWLSYTDHKGNLRGQFSFEREPLWGGIRGFED